MTLLSPLDGAHEESAPLAPPRRTSGYQITVHDADLPPLRVTTDVSVPSIEATPLRLLDEAGVRDAMGRFAAATLLPVTASDATREQVRASWAGAVAVVEVATHPHWTLTYIPGSHVGDALVYAIHRPTGHVFGGDHGETVQQSGESTHVWLDRLTAEFDGHAAAYSLTYRHLPDHA